MESHSTAADAPYPTGHAVADVRQPVGITADYQPALDGVRAVAVLMVMGFHLGYVWLARGGAGVDVFFVLSGYLITTLLLREYRRTGTISLRRFYVRRFLRLAPLAFATVLVVWALSAMGIAEKVGLYTPSATAASILFYYANWWSIHTHFDMGPFGHMWSLSVEEQFYFVWPAVLVAAIWIAGRRAIVTMIVLVATTIVVFGVYRQLLFSTGSQAWPLPVVPGFRFEDIGLGSFLRPDGLLFGCLLALLLERFDARRLHRRWVAVLGTAGLVTAVIALVWSRSPYSGFGVNLIPPWGLSLFVCGTTLTIAWLVLDPTSRLARFLSLGPLCWVGRRAYGIYVLHPLVYRMLDSQWGSHGLAAKVVRISLSLVLAGLSYRYFETPFLRLKERFAPRSRVP